MSATATTFFDFDEKLFPRLHYASSSVRTERTVLLVEDDEDLRLTMECILRSIGYGVVPCADGHLALEAYQKSPETVDVLLTDLHMPGMSGLELARELTEGQATLPVLLLTGSILTVDDIKELMSRGWAYMANACDMKILSGTLHRLAHRNSRTSRC